MNVALLTLATFGVVVPAAAVAETCLGTGHILPATAAVGLCWPAAVVTLVLGEVIARRSPTVVPVAVMAGAGLRMAAAVAGTFALGEVLAQAGVPRERFGVWVTVVYLFTLMAESALQIRGAVRVGAP